MKKLILMLMLCAPMTLFAQKFGVVDIDAVGQALPEYSKVQGELKSQAQQADNDLKSMQDEIQRKADEYQKGASTMNQTAKEAKEKELNDLYQKYQETQQQKAQELQKAQQDKVGPIQAKVMKAIENVGKAGSYTIIFPKGSQPYISATIADVTDKVKAEALKLK